jgi:predicted transcriptional regulator
MFSRFQVLVSSMQVLVKNYITKDLVNKILRSLPVKWRSKVTYILEAANLNKMGLETLISSFKSHELELIHDEPKQKIKSIALKSKGKKVRAFQDDKEAP